VRKYIVDSGLFRCPLIHQLPFVREEILDLGLPRELCYASRKGGLVPLVLEIVYEDPHCGCREALRQGPERKYRLIEKKMLVKYILNRSQF
jgi:hypothetical protein